VTEKAVRLADLESDSDLPDGFDDEESEVES